MRIVPRATTILTDGRIAIVVPSSSCVSGKAVHWSSSDRDVRFPVPAGVACGSGTTLVEEVLLEVAPAPGTHGERAG